MSKQLSFEFQTKFARRVPDPVFHKQYGMERHFFFVPVSKVPKQLPMDPNARVPNIRRTVYKEVRESLLNPDGRFHLKHKGITVVASAVEKRSDTVYLVKLGAGQGVLDGGHSYTLIIQEQDEGNLPENQFVKFEIVTGAPLAWIAEMAGGLNTSVRFRT